MNRVLLLVLLCSTTACSTLERPQASSVALRPCPSPPVFKTIAHGMGGNDQVFGGGAPAQLFGDDDRDLIVGASAVEEINGGKDADVLFGGGGADRFTFAGVEDSRADRAGHWSIEAGDTLIDFKPTDGDLIVLSEFETHSPLHWTGTPRPFGIWARRTATDTFVYLDTSGDRRADFALRLLGKPALDATAVCA